MRLLRKHSIGLTSTEFDYLDGVTSGIQTQMDGKSTASSTDSLTNKTFDANATGNSLSNVDLSADVTGTLPVADGGTGVTSKTGTGNVVLSSSPTLVTPALGTVASGIWQGTAIDGTYIDLEGTEVKSTGESGGSKYLREDGDGTCSWQTPTSSPTGTVNLGDGGILIADEVQAYDGAGLFLRDAGGTDGIFVENGGNVGIGTTNPNNVLALYGDSNYLLYVKQTNAVIHMMALRGPSSAGIDFACDGTNNKVVLNSVGSGDKMDFCTNDGLVRMSIASGGEVSGDFNDTSDIGLKENIKSLESGALAKINLLRPVSFDWKEEKDSTVGFIAQEVEKIFPSEVVGENYVEGKIEQYSINTGKAINTIGIVAHLTKAIQELSAKVTALEGA
jgi:hypothetical protein